MTASGQTVSGSATASAQAERIAASATEPADLEAPRPQYARLDSVVRYSAAGVPTRITAADSGEPGINALAPLYGRIPSDTVAKLKGAYAHFIRSSDAAHRFRNTLQVLDALEAPTKEEYHRRIKALPVRVEAVPTVGADGRMGTRKDYFLEGRLTLSTFESPIDLKAEPASIEDQRSGPSAATLDGDLGAHDDCTHVR